ncbi:MAG: UDP-N-acetylmuramate dehydrogenase [Chloroflexota bacterium]
MADTLAANMPGFWKALPAHLQKLARRNEPLSGHTTLRLGGPADIWLPVQSIDDLVQVTNLARLRQIPIFLLGGGANLLIRDSGIRGLVIENRANQVQFQESTVLVESGAVNPRLAKQCAKKGLSGLEWMVGVPGTIGGATVNNAGAYGQSMADTLLRAELLNPSGERHWVSVTWFDYHYRSSKLKRAAEKFVVLQVELNLTPQPTADINQTMQSYNQRRKATQPPGATIGSMFKNPPGDYAGRLIEAVGLKGYRQNQAQISPIHANFFVNLGNAQADDVVALIELAQKRVWETFQILLELEVEIVPT